MKTRMATENKSRQDWFDWVDNFIKNPYELTKEEGLALRDAVMGNERIAARFFYEIMSPMNSGMRFQVLKVYKVEVSEYDIATMVYCENYNGGKWGRLSLYKGECSLFTWVALGAAQIVYNELEKEGVIQKSRSLGVKNTSLTLKSMKYVVERQEVIDLVKNECWHGLLTKLYVEGKKEEEVMNELSMTEEVFKKTRKIAENTLKELLIEAEFLCSVRDKSFDKKYEMRPEVVNLVTLALSVHVDISTTTSDEAFAIAEKSVVESDVFAEFKDMLCMAYPGLENEEMWMAFLRDQAEKSGMSKDMLEVWTARYVHLESPQSIAVRMNMNYANILNLYSRGNRLLVERVKYVLNKNL